MITPEETLHVPLLSVLPKLLLLRVLERAADIRTHAGEWIAHDGDPAYFWILLEGEVETVKLVGGDVQQMTTFDPGEYFGEVPLMLSAAAFAGIRAIVPSRLMRIDPSDFHALIHESTEVWEMLGMSLNRRVNFIRDSYANTVFTQATIVGNRYDMACHDLRDFMMRNQISFEWLDPSNACDATFIPAEVTARGQFPTVLLPGDRVLYDPDARTLAQAAGLQIEPRHDTYDVVVIGGGPTGLASAVYGGSEGLRTVLIEKEAPGGQAGTSSRIENYLGFPGGVSGSELARRALLQAKRFGTEIIVTRSIVEMRPGNAEHTVVLDGGVEIRSKCVVLATGVTWRRLTMPGSDRLTGRGLYYGAARTEAIGMQGKEIFLVGGGNSAGQAAMFFSNYAKNVTILIRADSLAKSMSSYLIEQLSEKCNIHVESATTIAEMHGEVHLEAITTRNARTGELTRRAADGVFAFIGATAQTDWLPDGLVCDKNGYVCTGRDIEGWPLERAPFPLETKIPGIFAAGDVRSGSIKRVASGVGEGSIVISYVHQYLELTNPELVLS